MTVLISPIGRTSVNTCQSFIYSLMKRKLLPMPKIKLHGSIAVTCPNCRAINLHPASGWLGSTCPKCQYNYPHPFTIKQRGRPYHGREAKRMTVSIPKPMHDRIRIVAEQYETTPSAIIRAGISSLLQTPE